MEQVKKRIEWIDVLKGISLICVVLGHRVWANYGMLPEFVKLWIYSFHMPLFFFLSGITFSVDKYKNFYEFIVYKAKTILLPMAVFTIIREVFEYIYYGVLLNNTEYNLSELWFLACLFIVHILLYFIIKLFKDKNNLVAITIILMYTLGVIFSKTTELLLPWKIDVALISIIFVGAGYLFKKIQSFILNKSNFIFIILLLILNLVSAILNYVVSGKTVDLAISIVGNPLLFIIGAFSGIFFFVFVFKSAKGLKVLKYMGKNSLIFYGLSDLMMFIPDIVIYNILNLDIQSMGNASVVVGVFYAILVNLSIFPICWLINKKFSFILGKF